MTEQFACDQPDCNKSYRRRGTLLHHRRVVHKIYAKHAYAVKADTPDNLTDIGPVPSTVTVRISANGLNGKAFRVYLLSLSETVDAVAGALRQALVHKGVKVQ